MLPERIEKVWIRLCASLLRDAALESPAAPRNWLQFRHLDAQRDPDVVAHQFVGKVSGPRRESPSLFLKGLSVGRSFSTLTRSSRVAASIIGPIIDCACPSLPDDRLPWIRYRFLSGYGPNYGLVCRSNRGDIYDI